MDTIKVKLQKQVGPLLRFIYSSQIEYQSETVNSKIPKRYNGFIHALRVILKEEGLPGIFRGVTASMMREASYSSIRMGLYEPVRNWIDPNKSPNDIKFSTKLISGLISGGIGNAIANPTDVVKVRFQARLPDQPRMYNNTLHAFVTISKEEGLRGLYKVN